MEGSEVCCEGYDLLSLMLDKEGFAGREDS